MKRTLFVGFLLLSQWMSAQFVVTIEARVLDAQTKEPIVFANIGFVDRGIGTVSDEQGNFTIIYDEEEVGANDLLQISTIGYETKQIKAADLFTFFEKSNIVYLEEERYLLDTVILTPEERENRLIGNGNINNKRMGYWKDKSGLGGEIATRLRIRNENTQLLDFNFNILENTADSLLVRVNVYDYRNRYPRQNLLNTNIYHVITTKKGKETIPLKPYKIVVDDDVVISIELIEVYGDDIMFAVAASLDRGISYTRTISQDRWNRFEGLGMGFTFNSTYPGSATADALEQRESPRRLTLYWDTSLLMKQRNLKEELDLVKRYVRKLKNVEVDVIKFGSTASTPRKFSIRKGKSNELLTYLTNTNYQGVANYRHVIQNPELDTDAVLIFTDGNSVLAPLESKVNAPVFVINSLPKARHEALQDVALITGGHYVNLHKFPSKDALEFLQYDVKDTEVYRVAEAQDTRGWVYGKVSSPQGPLQGATVRIKGSFVETRTDADGSYTIDAQPEDVLEVNYLTTLPREVVVTEGKRYDVQLTPDGELLEEVYLEATVEKPKTIESGYGKKNFDAVGFAITELPGEEIKEFHVTWDQVIQKIPGVIVQGIGNEKRYTFGRNFGSSIILDTGPIIVVDNIVYVQNEDGNSSQSLDQLLPQIDMSTIESISTLKSGASAQARFGVVASGGAIIVKTQASSFDWIQPEEEKESALVKGNDYSESVRVVEVSDVKASYQIQLEKATSKSEAFAIYSRQEQLRTRVGVPYYLDVADYFRRWDAQFAYDLLLNVVALAGDSPKALRVVAFKMEEWGRFEDARYIYERIAQLRPNQAQSIRDLAHIYQETGRIATSFERYKQILANKTEGTNFDGIQAPAEHEIQRLIALNRQKINLNEVPSDLLDPNFKKDIRMVFQWSDPDAEFALQFVNPQKKFFTWEHSMFEDRQRMIAGTEQGFMMEEFIIDDAPDGNWLINVQYTGTEISSKTPVYLKYTRYENFGQTNETRVIKTIKLFKHADKVTLDAFMN